MAGSTLVQLRVPDDLLARIDEASGESTRTAWLLGVAERELDGGTPAPVQPAGARLIGPGVPAPGAPCLWAACTSRDCDRYGVTDPTELTWTDYLERARDEDKAGHTLCKRHAAQLEGREYKAPRRELPPSWRRRQPDPAPS